MEENCSAEVNIPPTAVRCARTAAARSAGSCNPLDQVVRDNSCRYCEMSDLGLFDRASALRFSVPAFTVLARAALTSLAMDLDM